MTQTLTLTLTLDTTSEANKAVAQAVVEALLGFRKVPLAVVVEEDDTEHEIFVKAARADRVTLITDLASFIRQCDLLEDISDAHELFEHECSADFRDTLMALATPGAEEPFRSAMWNIGFRQY